jgi:hypothetical protein
MADHAAGHTLVTGLAGELHGFGGVAGRARMVAFEFQGVRPGGKQRGDDTGLLEATGQAQARLDDRQRGAGLSLAQQDPGSVAQQAMASASSQ